MEIRTKDEMHALLVGGALGNTVPQFLSEEEWRASPESRVFPTWGVRTLTPGGPCRLYCPASEVGLTARQYREQGHRVNISLMIDAVATVTLYGEVWESPEGLRLYGVERPGKGASWRKVMPELGREWRGLSVRMMLKKHLNASSLADLEALLENHPGHVVEFSALEQCMGTVPGRNGIVWEVRTSTGRYERPHWRQP